MRLLLVCFLFLIVCSATGFQFPSSFLAEEDVVGRDSSYCCSQLNCGGMSECSSVTLTSCVCQLTSGAVALIVIFVLAAIIGGIVCCCCFCACCPIYQRRNPQAAYMSMPGNYQPPPQQQQYGQPPSGYNQQQQYGQQATQPV